MKKAITAILFFVFTAFLFCVSAYAEDSSPGSVYYIDAENGSDENSGLRENEAWRTLSRICENEGEIKPGDTILLKRGQTFEGGIKMPAGGEEGKPVTLSAYGEGEKPLITDDNEYVILLFFVDVSYWNISDLRFSTPRGCAIYFMAGDEDVSHITVSDCDFFDISKEELEEINTFFSAININNAERDSRVHNIEISRITVRDCAYGIHSNGNDDEGFGVVQNPETDYNYNIHITDSVFENCRAGAVIFGACYLSTAENCLIKDCATNPNFACAPIWFRHCDSCVVDHCEISGSTNRQDGMTVDFDGWTTNCTYQYIYSHDNNRFLKNCLYDRFTRNAGNSVKHCLSVNDNISRNLANTPLIVVKNFFGMALGMKDFTFENNTLVNIQPVHFDMLWNMNISNNIIIGKKETKWLTFFTNFTALMSFGKMENNCFYDYCAPFNAKNSVTQNPGLDENYVSAQYPSLGALDGTNYVGCRLEY